MYNCLIVCLFLIFQFVILHPFSSTFVSPPHDNPPTLFSTAGMASEVVDEDDNAGHRLQRQDAKSRKTFKIKRATTKTSKRPRFMSHRRRPDGAMSLTDDGSPTRSSVVFQESQNSFAMRRPSGLARSVETIPESMESKVHPNAARV